VALSKEEAWLQFATEVGGEFVKGGRGLRRLFGGKPDRVLVQANQWPITLDTYEAGDQYTSTTYTRMMAPYVHNDGFRFALYRKTMLSGLGKLLGMQDIEVGYPDFDPDFMIKANDEFKVRELFAGSRIRQLIQSQPSIHLQVKHGEGWFRRSLPQNVHQLYFEEATLITDAARLKSLCELFGETLNRLYQIGSASKEAPGVQF
jgi:hypothetical protein